MKISKDQLKQIIQEELATSLNESIPPPKRTISSEPTEVVAPPPEDKNVPAGKLVDLSRDTNPYRDAPAVQQGPIKPIKEPETKPTIPTELSFGGTQEIPIGDRGTVNIGGSMRSGTYDNLDDLLSGVKFGGKGQYDLGGGIGAYGSVDYTIKPSAESLGKIQTTLGMGLTFNNMVDLGILVPFEGAGFGTGEVMTDDLQGRVGLNVGALNLAMHAGKGGARTGNIGMSANVDVGKLFKRMQALGKKQKLQEAIKRAIKEELTVVLNERGDPIEVTVDMDGRAIAAKVAKSHSSRGKW